VKEFSLIEKQIEILGKINACRGVLLFFFCFSKRKVKRN